MSTPEVGSGKVAIYPVFTGFRKAVSGMVDGSTKDAGQQFTRGFTSAGTTAGKGFSEGFKRQTSSVSGDALKKATDDVAKATRELAAARLKEQDAVGRSRVAEAGLADARKRFADDSVQVIRAEERLATAQRQVAGVQDNVENSTERLAAAKRSLADASNLAADSGSGWRSRFGGIGGDAADGFTSRFRSRVGEIFTGNFLAGVALSIGRSVLQGAVTGIQAGVRFSFDSIQLASDLGESLNAANVSFGEDVAEQLRVLSESAPQRLALTRRSFLQFSTQFSAFAKIIRRDSPADFIDDLTERGADFASVFNVEVDEALRLFQSGLAGETEPLRRYGLDLSAATVQAYAWANGITANGKALTENEKIQARWGALLEQTSAVQGDNANTADELAGQQRRLAVAFEEAQTKLGEYLIPGFLDLVSIANDELLPVVGDVIDRVGPKLGAALEGVDWEGFAAEIAPAVERIAELTAEDGIPNLVSLLENVAELAPIALDSANQDLEDFNDLLNIFQGDWSRLREENPWLEEIGVVLADGEILFGEAGADFMDELAVGIEENLGGPQAAASVTLRKIREGVYRETEIGLRRGGGGSFDAGANISEGLARGIESGKGRIGRAASDAANEARKAIERELDINSPSRVAFELGQYTGDGFSGGLKDKERQVAQSAAAMVSSFTAATASYGSASGSTAAGAPAIYVQNPFTGEYLLAQARVVADDAVREGKASTAAAISGGVVL